MVRTKGTRMCVQDLSKLEWEWVYLSFCCLFCFGGRGWDFLFCFVLSCMCVYPRVWFFLVCLVCACFNFAFCFCLLCAFVEDEENFEKRKGERRRFFGESSLLWLFTRVCRMMIEPAGSLNMSLWKEERRGGLGKTSEKTLWCFDLRNKKKW